MVSIRDELTAAISGAYSTFKDTARAGYDLSVAAAESLADGIDNFRNTIPFGLPAASGSPAEEYLRGLESLDNDTTDGFSSPYSPSVSCENNVNSYVANFHANNPSYTGWVSYIETEFGTPGVNSRPGGVNDVWTIGGRCANAVASDGGIQGLLNGSLWACFSGPASSGKTTALSFHWVCGVDSGEPVPPPVNPTYNINIASSPGGLQFGTPYLDEDGVMHIPFLATGDDGSWGIPGSVNTNTGEIDFGFGGDPSSPPELGDENEDGRPDIEDCICGPDDENSWPLTIPAILTDDSYGLVEVGSIPEMMAWLVRNMAATNGAWPVKLTIEDSDPFTEGGQAEEISIPNQAEMLGELFGLVYENSTNISVTQQAIFRLIPEVLATRTTGLISQDFITTMAEYMGMRVKDKQIEFPINFEPDNPESIAEFFQQSIVFARGTQLDDKHTMVEWLQKIHFWSQIAAAPNFRSADDLDVLVGEIESFTDGNAEKSAQDWEDFIEYLNSQFSTINRSTNHPRPKAYSVDDLDDDATQIPTT